jgi:hypothetical protein
VSTLTDLALELAWYREQQAGFDEDEIEVLAIRSLDFYLRVLPRSPRDDDPRNGVGFWRGTWRRRLAGEDAL